MDTSRKDKDLQLWLTWRRTGLESDLKALVDQLMPAIRNESKRWGRIVQPTLLDNESKRLAIKAFNSYDPSKGTALATHVVNALQKLSRTAYPRQSTLSVPEHKRITFNTFNRVQAQLLDLHGRPPSFEDVADHMNLPPKKLRALVGEVGKKEFMESGDGPSFVQHMDDPEVVNLAFHDMTGLQRQIFKMRTGYEGAQVRSGDGIMHELGITQGQLSYQRKLIEEMLLRAQRLRA